MLAVHTRGLESHGSCRQCSHRDSLYVTTSAIGGGALVGGSLHVHVLRAAPEGMVSGAVPDLKKSRRNSVYYYICFCV